MISGTLHTSGGLPTTPNSKVEQEECDSTPKLKLILMRVLSVPTPLIKSLVCKHFTHAATGYHLKDVLFKTTPHPTQIFTANEAKKALLISRISPLNG